MQDFVTPMREVNLSCVKKKKYVWVNGKDVKNVVKHET